MRRVLLVDDELWAVEGLRMMANWETYGFRIDGICADGEEAMRRICADPPDLVVTDIRMPVMDGLQLIQETRRRGDRTTVFVIASGYHDFEYARQAMRLGVFNYLTKPIMEAEADDVLQRLQRELNERDLRNQVQARTGEYAVDNALSQLLDGASAGGELDPALTSLSQRASAWTYLHVEAEAAECRGAAREAARRFAGTRRGCCYVIEHDRSAFGLVCGLEDAIVRASGRPALHVFAEELHRELRSVSSGRVGIAAGRTVDRLADLHLSQRSAADAADFLYFDKSIVYFADISDKAMALDPDVLSATDTIIEAVEHGDPQSVAAAIDEAFSAFEARMLHPELIGVFSTRVWIRCASILQEMGGDPDELLARTDSDNWLHTGRHWREAADRLLRFCLNCQAAVVALQSSHTGGTQARVADFLRLHFRETFTIKEIAERFYMNHVYLGQSFARKYGMSILDYMHDLRIREAGRLLTETDDPSFVIAESVGYRGYQHFLKQFEKRFGMKPAEYREKMKTQ